MATPSKATKTTGAKQAGGEGNGGGADNPGLITGTKEKGERRDKKGLETRLNAMKRPDDNGDREAVPAAELDRVFTQESKEKWDDQNPSFADQLKASRKTDEAIAKKEEDK